MRSKKNLRALVLLCGIVSACSFEQNKGTATQSSVSSQSVSSFQTLQETIFQPRCFHCHSGPGADGGVDLSSYAAIRANQGLVVSGDPANSRIYREVSSGDMPKGGPPLTPAQVHLIEQWILAGAPDGEFSKATETSFQTTDEGVSDETTSF